MRLIIAALVLAFATTSSANDVIKLIEINDKLLSIVGNKLESDRVVMHPGDKLSHKLAGHFAKKGYRLAWNANEISVDKPESFYVGSGLELSTFFKAINDGQISLLKVLVDETNKTIFVF